MKKRVKIKVIALSIILILLIFANIISFKLSITANAIDSDNFSSSIEYHWPKMPVLYKFDNLSLCGNIVPIRVRSAFDEIQNETNNSVSFLEVNDSSAEIIIYCFKELPASPGKKGYLISAESSYYLMGNIISNGSIDFFNVRENTFSPGCVSKPNIEVHEILHLFGFEHNNQTKSIMDPLMDSCIWNIDTDIVSKLKEIYSR